MNRGKVKWVDQQKAMGFIVPDDGGGDVFFHKNAIAPNVWPKLGPGSDVVYESETTAKGQRLTAMVSATPAREALRCAEAIRAAAEEAAPDAQKLLIWAAELCEAIGASR